MYVIIIICVPLKIQYKKKSKLKKFALTFDLNDAIVHYINLQQEVQEVKKKKK